ncbi:protein of unknown function DUF1707 [Kribbella flavida DSM 17836]|uniref:DUF1707 domain-containing protein n=1 Tax=Kribbella flavida (strain DSM 17836 / JCM 10339 / NBRC 14399) TaxID=479435 RepID=D2PQ96_KRIFD|nr:DUF1707 domain-containing protein [Kribbella flavida]ADB34798.1 protein of unknown function DUF1707 [Kribbella flavida DSM 17836]
MSQVPDRVVRIGDAERDQAVASLGDHFVAGRLTQEEFEERSERATRARYTNELTPLFADLPEPVAVQPELRGWGPGPQQLRAGPPPAFFFLLPVLVIGLVVASVSFAAPWILWMFFWIALFGGPVHRRRQHGYGHRHR